MQLCLYFERMIESQKNTILTGAQNRAFAFDFFCDREADRKLPVVIFVHGFKGFKDWGHWAAMAEMMAEQGCVVITMNLSHNGVTPEQPLDFVDLEAFGNNRYSYEITDISAMLDWLHSGDCGFADRIDLDQICLIGHSRAGATCLLVAAEDERVSRLVTWASVARFDYSHQWLDEALCRDWLKEGVTHVLNGRTQQMMPLYRSLYDDWAAQSERFDSQRLAQALQKPWLIIHGSADPAVPQQAAETLYGASDQDLTTLVLLDTDHVFGGKHPHIGDLSAAAKQVVLATAAFVC